MTTTQTISTGHLARHFFLAMNASDDKAMRSILLKIRAIDPDLAVELREDYHDWKEGRFSDPHQQYRKQVEEWLKKLTSKNAKQIEDVLPEKKAALILEVLKERFEGAIGKKNEGLTRYYLSLIEVCFPSQASKMRSIYHFMF